MLAGLTKRFHHRVTESTEGTTWIDWHFRGAEDHGRRYLAADLCKKVTGKELSADPLLRHLTEKAEAVYGI